MNFTFYDNFKRFSLSCSDSDLYIAFMSTPYSELHFFDKSTYVGSLVFEDFKNSGYHFELSKLRTLLFSVKSFEDVVDFSRVFSHFNSNTLMLVDANGSYRELSLMGAKRMDFDSKKKISVIPYLINIRDMIEKTYKDKAVGIFVPSDYSGELQKYFKCFSDVSAIGKYDIVVDCFLKTSEYKRLKRENSNLIQADVLVLMLLMPVFLSNLKKVGITLTVIVKAL